HRWRNHPAQVMARHHSHDHTDHLLQPRPEPHPCVANLHPGICDDAGRPQQRDAVLRVLLVPDRVCGWADGLCRRAGLALVRDHRGADRAGLPVVEPLGLLRGRAITLPGTARPASRFSKHVRTGAARGGGYLLCLLGSAVMLLPFIWMVRSSVMELAQIFAFPPQWIPHPLRLSNYREAFTAVPSLHYLLNTLTILIP